MTRAENRPSPAGPALARVGSSPGSARRKYALKRFGELVTKHALGTATAADMAKLERYQVLRRMWHGTHYSTPEDARREWRDRQMIKALTAYQRGQPDRLLKYQWRASPNTD